MSLATVSPTGSPACRLLVVRDVRDDASLIACTDARSEKVDHLMAETRVEACFWFARERRQYRLRGVAQLRGPDGDDARDLWQQMSDSARALFAWPTPMMPRAEDEAFTSGVSAEAPIPENFRVLVVVPASCDRLDLNAVPHHRTIWTRSVDGWGEEAVNP